MQPRIDAPHGVVPTHTPPIWIFLALDCASFGVFFLAFMVERMGQVELFDRSAQSLDARIGFANACILITSSWLVAAACQAGLAGRVPAARRLLAWAMAVAACFGVAKVYEYWSKLAEGITFATNDFFVFYYALTGIHLVHYLVGMVILGILASGPGEFGKPAEIAARYRAWLTGGALYWHMVDLLWIFIFSLLYLVGAR